MLLSHMSVIVHIQRVLLCVCMCTCMRMCGHDSKPLTFLPKNNHGSVYVLLFVCCMFECAGVTTFSFRNQKDVGVGG